MRRCLLQHGADRRRLFKHVQKLLSPQCKKYTWAERPDGRCARYFIEQGYPKIIVIFKYRDLMVLT